METTIATAKRIRSIDILRGIVMLIMALDHVRDFTHNTAMTADPLDVSTTSPVLFFTRWITHFCAPIFVFLSGTSAFLASQKRTKKEASFFLIKRGIWLVIVEITIITLAITFNPSYNFIVLQVIWAIGCSMILLGLLFFANVSLIVVLGCILVAGHNIFDYITLPANGFRAIVLSMLFTNTQRVIPITASHLILDLYVVLPWTGIMLLGYAFGTLYKNGASAAANKNIFWIGVFVTVLFVIVRAINKYGDPSHWSHQKTALYTVLSFVNTTKYPPSLLYSCMTLGPAILLLSRLDAAQNAFSRIATTYGRVPFFYYVCHFFLVHFACMILFYAQGYGPKDIVNPASPFYFRPTKLGVSLPYVYLIWLLIIVVLYLPCRWFNKYRSTHKQWWLSYL